MHKLTEEYKNDIKRYDDFKLKIEVLIKELLIQNGLNFHKVESRTKDALKLDEKILRKNEKYSSLSEITDLIGIRIITYFEDEVDKVAKTIDSEFVTDKENSIDKRELESDRFGYKSLHYVVSLTTQRKKLTEYKRFKDIKIEIQIRSVLQHAWAEIEHDLGYKGEFAIPDLFKRNFYRVAALLETADVEFVNIKNGLLKYESSVAESIKKQPQDVELNSVSLKSYIINNSSIKELDKKIATMAEATYIGDDFQMIEAHIEKLQYLNINTIKELEIVFKKNINKIVPFAKEWLDFRSHKGGRFSAGVSLFYLCYIILAQKSNIDFANQYYNKFFNANDNESGAEIIRIYNKIK